MTQVNAVRKAGMDTGGSGSPALPPAESPISRGDVYVTAENGVITPGKPVIVQFNPLDKKASQALEHALAMFRQFGVSAVVLKPVVPGAAGAGQEADAAERQEVDLLKEFNLQFKDYPRKHIRVVTCEQLKGRTLREYVDDFNKRLHEQTGDETIHAVYPGVLLEDPAMNVPAERDLKHEITIFWNSGGDKMTGDRQDQEFLEPNKLTRTSGALLAAAGGAHRVMHNRADLFDGYWIRCKTFRTEQGALVGAVGSGGHDGVDGVYYTVGSADADLVVAGSRILQPLKIEA